MAYRRTERTEARLAAARERVVAAAFGLVAEGGWSAVSMTAVATRADISTGAVYRHFHSKGELCAEVFRRASTRELAVLAAIAAQPEPDPARRLAAVVGTFVRRALEGGRLAYALLAEPVHPAVETERLAFRRRYRTMFATLVRAAVAGDRRVDPAISPELAAAALVGAISETLLGPLAQATEDDDRDALVTPLIRLALRTAGVAPTPRLLEVAGAR